MELQGSGAVWLRWATLEGVLLPTEREKAEQKRQRAEQEKQRSQELELFLNRYRERFGDLPE